MATQLHLIALILVSKDLGRFEEDLPCSLVPVSIFFDPNDATAACCILFDH